jgi:eukaryotic-like serine/threonine-protein kinase
LPRTYGALDGERVDEQPKIGAVIGQRYRLVGLLGRGGMGSVFAAEDIKRDTRVALKLMHPHLGRVREAQQRFRHEASALHRLRSEHVARLYDYGHHQDGSPYLVMELVQGHDLTRDIAQRGKLPWHEAHSIIEHVCLALEAVHAAGLIHRDLKPRNVIVARENSQLFAKVVDFGLSKSHLPDTRAYTPITRAGMAVGSLHYMAPEQAVGSPYVDARADVFSVGCILFFLLMGEPPFSQRVLARAGRTGSSLTFASVHHRRADVPAYVDEVLRVALAPDPAHRFRTIGALRIALASDIPLARTAPAHCNGASAGSGTFVPPRPRVAYLVVALTALVLVAAIVWLLLAR